MDRFLRVAFALFMCVVVARPLVSQSTGEAAQRAASARIQPGDRIILRVFREPDLSGEMLVNERGSAPFPKLGLLDVSALSIAQIQDTLLARYSVFLRNPTVEVAVLRRVAVQGEVRMPNVYMVDVTTTLRDIIARAGGLTSEGDRKKVYLERDGKRTRLPNWQSDRGPESDVRSGDQIIVGRKNWLALNLLPAISTSVVVVSLLYSVTR